MADKEFDNTLNAVERIISTCIFNIANELDDLSDIEKLKIYSEIEQLAMDAIQDAKQIGALHWMYYLVLIVYFSSIGGTAPIYVDDFRSLKYCQMAKAKWIEVHLQDLIKRKATSNIINISCVHVGEGW